MDGFAAWKNDWRPEHEANAERAIKQWIVTALASRFDGVLSEPLSDALLDIVSDCSEGAARRTQSRAGVAWPLSTPGRYADR